MSVQSYPWTASVFKGEGRFLITTLVEHIGGYKTHADEVTIVSETEDDLVDKLGNKVLSRIKAVENSPLYVGKPKQFWKNGSKYKGYITFWKHNFLAYVKSKFSYILIILDPLYPSIFLVVASSVKHQITFLINIFGLGKYPSVKTTAHIYFNFLSLI